MMNTATDEQRQLLPSDKKEKERSFGRKVAENLGSGPFSGSIIGSILGSFKRGGKVRKTGVYKLHRGEKVLTRKQSRGHTR